jgi:hypothetical protein
MATGNQTNVLVGLIASLKPAPTSWLRAAQELPSARIGLDGDVRSLTRHETPLPTESASMASRIDGGVGER